MIVSKTSFFYLHGFASGPSSAKAKLFSEKLRQLGVQVVVPDLNQPAFEEMTLTSQLQVIESCARSANPETDFTIVGSSMGGLLATIFAQARPSVKALILLAPGFELLERWKQWLGEAGMEKWQRDGVIPIYHYSFEREMPLNYGFLEDARKYDSDNLRVNIPTLVFHGTKDTVVPLASSLRFCRRNPEVAQLVELKDDHQLLRSAPAIWSTTQAFLQKHELL